MADTVPGSALVTPVTFGHSNETVDIIYDRIRIRVIHWNYPDGNINLQLDYGRDNPLFPGTNEWFLKTQLHPIVNLLVGDTVILNGITFVRPAGNHYSNLVAAITVAAITTQEDLEDKIFARLIAIGYFPGGVES